MRVTVKCVNKAQQFERDIFNVYINAKCSSIYNIYIAGAYTSAICCIFGPFFLLIPITINVEYPFEVDYIPVNIIIYLHQYAPIFACTEHLSMHARSWCALNVVQCRKIRMFGYGNEENYKYSYVDLLL